MKANTEHLKALSELTWLIIIRLSYTLFNHISEQWNSHPYFNSLGRLPKLESENLEKIFVTCVAGAVGDGGKPLSADAIQAQVRSFFQQDAIDTYKDGILPEPAIRMCADMALSTMNIHSIAESIYMFASLHRDIIPALMISLLKKVAKEHPQSPLQSEDANEAFVASAFKGVGDIEKLVPLLAACRNNVTATIVRNLMAKGDVGSTLVGEIDQFVLFTITDFAKKRLI